MNEYQAVLEKLRKIEMLYAGTNHPGEKLAAEAAIIRIKQKLASLQQTEPEEVWRFSLDNPWSRSLLIALLRRYGVQPFRRHGQKRTTIMAKMPHTFAEKTFMPEFNELNDVLLRHLDKAAEQIIKSAISNDIEEPKESK